MYNFFTVTCSDGGGNETFFPKCVFSNFLMMSVSDTYNFESYSSRKCRSNCGACSGGPGFSELVGSHTQW